MSFTGHTLGAILRHDRKNTSYKIALLRAINDVVLAYPDLGRQGQEVAVPLRRLAEQWVAYYWPFVNSQTPILQGATSHKEDMAFRQSLTQLRQLWEQEQGGWSHPQEGFFVINEFRRPRKQARYSQSLLTAYETAVRKIKQTIRQPIQYAGVGEWSVFDRPQRWSDSRGYAVAIPGTKGTESCIYIDASLWEQFHELSLWIEALCIHEWCLFTEAKYPHGEVKRGQVYELLTARPDNRRPLTWERNQIDILMMEGQQFVCPWSQQPLKPIDYALDHIIPLAIYPTNELWNLVPSNPHINSHTKRDRLPHLSTLERAIPHLTQTYTLYQQRPALNQVLLDDVALRFGRLEQANQFAVQLTTAVVSFVDQLGQARYVERF